MKRGRVTVPFSLTLGVHLYAPEKQRGEKKGGSMECSFFFFLPFRGRPTGADMSIYFYSPPGFPSPFALLTPVQKRREEAAIERRAAPGSIFFLFFFPKRGERGSHSSISSISLPLSSFRAWRKWRIATPTRAPRRYPSSLVTYEQARRSAGKMRGP